MDSSEISGRPDRVIKVEGGRQIRDIKTAAEEMHRRLERELMGREELSAYRTYYLTTHQAKVRRKENARRRKAKAAQTARRRAQTKASRRANR